MRLHARAGVSALLLVASAAAPVRGADQSAELPLVDYWTFFDAQPPVGGRDRNLPRPTLTFPGWLLLGDARLELLAPKTGMSLE